MTTDDHLDTNVVSELIDESIDEAVARWVSKHSAREFYTTVVTEAELFYGVSRLPEGKRTRAFEMTLERISSIALPGPRPAL
jgi:predicted nucleic acid-binding protein